MSERYVFMATIPVGSATVTLDAGGGTYPVDAPDIDWRTKTSKASEEAIKRLAAKHAEALKRLASK